MTDLARPAPFFIADHQALDFLNSIGAPWGKEIEWIETSQDLLNWLEKSGLILRQDLQEITESFVKEVDRKELIKVTRQAGELRDWFRNFVVKHAGRPLDPSILHELEPLNELLAKDSTYFQLDESSDWPCLRLVQKRRWKMAQMLLLPIAQSMSDLICQIEFVRIKNCEGPTCTMWFNDVSKNHTRRWCSMAVCGNRAKAAAYRAKKKLANEGVDK